MDPTHDIVVCPLRSVIYDKERKVMKEKNPTFQSVFDPARAGCSLQPLDPKA